MNYDVVVLGGRDVFAERYSVSQKEHFDAGIQEFKPVFRFDIRFFEYNNEDMLIYNDEKFVIYRTYQRSEFMELYVTRQAGVF